MEVKVKLSELIAKIGDDNVMFQNLDTDAIQLKTAKNGTEIKFGTPVPITPSGTKKLGLVVWLDRDAVEQAAKEPTNDN